MADKRISQLVERVNIANNDVLPIVASGATTTNKVTVSTLQDWMQSNLDVGVTSVGLSMPSAFVVSNSPVTGSGNISVTGAGTVSQYIRGDGSLADFPSGGGGGGASVNYYLNGSVSQGTIGGIAYQEMNKVPVLGAGTDFTIAADGYIASFITDAGDPALLEIPAGNWNFETYLQASSGGGTPTFYIELYKVDSGGTATLIASNSATPELIAFGTTTTPYFSALAVPTTSLALTDRLALRYYVTHSGRTITLHTENATLCQIITTFTTGLTALNGLTAQVQNFATGTSGTDFGITSSVSTHTFNLPTASASNRGALSSADWITFNNKQNALTNPVTGTGSAGQVAYWSSGSAITGESELFWDSTNNKLGIGITPSATLQVRGPNALGTFFDAQNEGAAGVLFERIANIYPFNRYTFSNGNVLVGGSITSDSFIRSGGTSSEFLKADGSVDSSTYLTTGSAGSTYVPYSGATSNVDLGVNTFTSSSVIVNGVGSNAGIIHLESNAFHSLIHGYGSISSGTTNQFNLYQTTGAGVFRCAILSLNSITASATRTFTLPDADGTLALTSNLGAYLPLTGGTLSNTLFGTTSIFGSAFASNQTSKIGIGFESGYGKINSWGADTSTYGGLSFEISKSNGDTYQALRINPDGTLYASAGGYYGLIDAAFLKVGGATAFSQVLTPPVAKFVNSANNFVKIALGQGETNPNFNDYYGIIALDNSTTLANNKLRFYLGYDDAATPGHSNDQLVLQGNGNVGIGTASPGVALDVRKDSGIYEIVRIQNNSAGALLRAIGFGGGSCDFGADDTLASTAIIRTGGTERMRITSGGFTKARANGGSYFGGSYHEFLNNNNVFGDICLLIGNRAGTNTNNSSSIHFLVTDAGGDKLYILGNGNVQNVNNSYGALSDIKLKENIEDATPKLDDLMKVKVRNYNLIGDDKKQIGVIAQELEEVFPAMIDESEDFEDVEVPQVDEEGNEILNEEGEVVTEKQRVSKGTSTKSVKYSVFVPMLIKAMQEQQEQIKELKTEIDSLKNQMQ